MFYSKSGDGIHLVVDQLIQDLIKRKFYVIAYPERRETFG